MIYFEHHILYASVYMAPYWSRLRGLVAAGFVKSSFDRAQTKTGRTDHSVRPGAPFSELLGCDRVERCLVGRVDQRDQLVGDHDMRRCRRVHSVQ
jgi:hypothetical protein